MKINRNRLHEIIFEAETREGKMFDLILMAAILVSVVVVILDSVASVRLRYHMLFITLEYIFTGLFTIEYALRIYSVKSPVRYITSFFGIIDLISILPTFLAILVPGAQSLLVIRIFRLLRIFRVLKLSRYHKASYYLIRSLQASRHKIFVFLATVLTIVVIMGALMYLIEGADSDFTDIPTGIYWAVVTITTVGYGDISPVTALGQMMASFLMIVGYAIIAVPTGIITAEIVRTGKFDNTISCPNCSKEGHDSMASYCKYCGHKL
ncbi:MAG TPA: ion transporter [Bacteroidales bacterium]|nr:ion transporter [Bacteroidales bacterium]HRZ49075.1 ion transporter [Bacteroidales bacterium]